MRFGQQQRRPEPPPSIEYPDEARGADCYYSSPWDPAADHHLPNGRWMGLPAFLLWSTPGEAARAVKSPCETGDLLAAINRSAAVRERARGRRPLPPISEVPIIAALDRRDPDPEPDTGVRVDPGDRPEPTPAPVHRAPIRSPFGGLRR